MTWEMFWITAAVVVFILIVLSQIASVRSWAGRVFGRVLPDFSAAGGVLKALGASNIARGLALAVVVGAPLLYAAVKYVEGRGADKVIAQVERRNNEANVRIGRAQVGFERDVRETMENAALRELEISEEFASVEQTILEAQGRDDIAAAHAAGVERLRTSASSRHAAVFSDYLSSVRDRPMRSPPAA